MSEEQKPMQRYRIPVEFDAVDLADANAVHEILTRSVASAALDRDRRTTMGMVEKRHVSWYEATS